MNSRRAAALTPSEVDAFLREPGHVMSLASVNHDASVHLCAMWYGFLPDGTIALTTYGRSQKARNLERDPRFTALVEDGSAYGQLRGLELVGIVELRSDVDSVRAALSGLRGRYPADGERDPRVDKRVAILLRVDRVVSWDHAKLGRKS